MDIESIPRCHSPSNPRDNRNHSFCVQPSPRRTSNEPFLPSRHVYHLTKWKAFSDCYWYANFSRLETYSRNRSSFKLQVQVGHVFIVFLLCTQRICESLYQPSPLSGFWFSCSNHSCHLSLRQRSIRESPRKTSQTEANPLRLNNIGAITKFGS